MPFWKSVTPARQHDRFRSMAFRAAGCLLAALLVGCEESNDDLAQRIIQQRTLANQQNKRDDEEDEARGSKKPAAKKDTESVASDESQPSVTPAPAASAPAASTAKTQPAADPPAEAAPQNEPFDDSSRNLTKIAAALSARANGQGYLTGQKTSKNPQGLSWRVHLLPFLGHQDLFNQFDLQKNWNESPNRELISQMPEVYRCDGLFGPYTRFRAVTSTGSVMGAASPVTSQQVSRPADTILVIEHPAKVGELWTKPGGFSSRSSDDLEDLEDLAKTRSGYLFGAFADGQAHPILVRKIGRGLALSFAFAGPAPPPRGSYIASFDASKMGYRGTPTTQSAPAWATSSEPSGLAGSAGRGAGGSSNRPSAGSGSAGRAAGVPEDTLAGKCLAAATKSKQQNDIPAMWTWLYSSVAAQLPTDVWSDEFKWVPGLGRPTLGLHWAVGLKDPDAEEVETDPEARYPDATPSVGREAILRVTTDLGLPVLKTIDTAANDSLPSVLASAIAEQGSGRRRAAPSTAPITYLKPNRRLRDMLDDANDCGADVLVVFSVKRESDRNALRLKVVLCDVARRKQLKRTSDIGKRGDRYGQAARENFQEISWELQDYIEKELTGSPWPAKLTEKIVGKLLARLAALGPDFPLRQLVEMRYYGSIELADNAQLLEVGRGLIGDSRSVNLLLGNDAKRRRVLERWFPVSDLELFLTQNQRTARRNFGGDDEDDEDD